MMQLLATQNQPVGGGGGGVNGGGVGGVNGNVGDDSSYPCAGFGQLPFKRDPGQSFPSVNESPATSKSRDTVATTDNNNSAGTEFLTKEKLWDLYLAGKVSLDGFKDVKPAAAVFSSGASDSDIEEIIAEEEDPAREGFSLND